VFLKPEVTTITELTSRSNYYKNKSRSAVKKSPLFYQHDGSLPCWKWDCTAHHL